MTLLNISCCKFLFRLRRESSTFLGTVNEKAKKLGNVIRGVLFHRKRSRIWLSFIIVMIMRSEDGTESFCINTKFNSLKNEKNSFNSLKQTINTPNTKKSSSSMLMSHTKTKCGIPKNENSAEGNIDSGENSTGVSFYDKSVNGKSVPPPLNTTKSRWRRRHARSIQGRIRRETTSPERLSSLLRKAQQESFFANRRLVARTMTGFLTAVAEKAENLSVEVTSRRDTPFWEKQIDSIEINFSRLEFRPLRLGGMSKKSDRNKCKSKNAKFEKNMVRKIPSNREGSEILDMTDENCMLEAFERIDADNSGTLDRDELATALKLITSSSLESDKQLLAKIASQLVDLYDANGDGVVDFEEYKLMVEQMAALQYQQEKQQEEEEKLDGILPSTKRRWLNFGNEDGKNDEKLHDESYQVNKDTDECATLQDDFTPLKSSAGSITLSDLKLDLRRLIFGAVPIIKKITPGGPLVLEPFVATVKGSFNNEDIMQSSLVDRGLRLLAARALRRRVRSFRDIIDGAVFYGRSWNMASVRAPVVEVPSLTAVEFDKRDRLIITGIARLRTSPEAPEIENGFKLRTRLGTRRDGQTIRLEQPELALVLECPKALERNIVSFCKRFSLTVPRKPDPIYSFFPIYSPFKLEEDDGFNMGPDNRLKSLDIRDGALNIEMQAILRPGRFLGSHYVAFTLPMRTCLITLDRVVGGIRTARRNKLEAQAAAKVEAERLELIGDGVPLHDLTTESDNKDDLAFLGESNTAEIGEEDSKDKESQVRPRKSFFSRFMEGYQGVDKEEEVQSERFTMAVSEWFARQGRINTVAANNSTKVDTSWDSVLNISNGKVLSYKNSSASKFNTSAE